VTTPPKNLATIVDRAVHEIDRVGIDNVSVSDLTRVSNLSRPTFYAYFDDLRGLLAEVWKSKGPTWLVGIADWSRREYGSPLSVDSLDRTMVELLVMAHRCPEVLEVVQPVMNTWWTQARTGSEWAATKAAWLVAERLGAILTHSVDASVGLDLVVDTCYPFVSDVPSGEAPARASGFGEIAPLKIRDDEPDAPLIQSTIEVIARSGVKSASMARIARNASVSTGTIYPRFPALGTLVETSFDAAMRSIVGMNVDALPQTIQGAWDFGYYVSAALDPVRTTWRNFRLEILVAARQRPKLAAKVVGTLEASRLDLAAKLAGLPHAELVAGSLGNLTHTLATGMSILQNCGLPVAGVDHHRMSIELTHAFPQAFAHIMDDARST
jgi:AcrR family transcriptional regulator